MQEKQLYEMQQDRLSLKRRTPGGFAGPGDAPFLIARFFCYCKDNDFA